MTAPTREQEDELFAEWMDAACLVWMPAPDVIEPSPGTHLSSGDVRQLIRVAWKRAYAAARAQALDEAAAVCNKEANNWDYDQGLVVAAKAIQALKGKP